MVPSDRHWWGIGWHHACWPIPRRRSRVIIQARLEQLGLLEEERDFLLQEKDTLVDRLGQLEARQGSFQERERQAENRGTKTVMYGMTNFKERAHIEKQLKRQRPSDVHRRLHILHHFCIIPRYSCGHPPHLNANH